jgi:hypothetical protein
MSIMSSSSVPYFRQLCNVNLILTQDSLSVVWLEPSPNTLLKLDGRSTRDDVDVIHPLILLPMEAPSLVLAQTRCGRSVQTICDTLLPNKDANLVRCSWEGFFKGGTVGLA